MTQALQNIELLETPGNSRPPGIGSGSLRTPDGVHLRFAVAKSQLRRTRGTVILLQGRNEAIEKYFETIDDLTRLGYMVATFDWRGQGGSARLLRNAAKGHVASFSDYAIDLESMLREVVLPDCRGPLAILAHSMGGAVALSCSHRLVNRIERIVACAPLVALPKGTGDTRRLHSAMTTLRFLGLGGIRIMRRDTARYWTAQSNPLTSDLRRFERNRQLAESAPQLFLGSPTAAWLSAATAVMQEFEDSDIVATYQVPTLIVTAGADTVVSSAAAERLAWRMRSGHFLGVAGARHELLQEADRYRAPFLAAFDSFAGGALPLD